MYKIEHYLTENGKDIVQDYLDAMRDLRAHVRILRRIDRVEQGNFGDCKRLSEGLFELRIDVGAGYREYYTQMEDRLILLLCAGDKKSQSADIVRSEAFRQDYISRMEVKND